MSLTLKQQLLKSGVVPERLSKRPDPLVPDSVACEAPPTRTYTHSAGAEGAEGASVVPQHWRAGRNEAHLEGTAP